MKRALNILLCTAAAAFAALLLGSADASAHARWGECEDITADCIVTRSGVRHLAGGEILHTYV